MVSSLQSPAYRLYFFATLGQYASMNMQIVTGPLLIYRLTGSSALLGTMSLAAALPMIIMSFLGGAIADRIPKKRILFIGLMCSALISLGIALALDTGQLSRENTGSWWILVVSSLCQGTVMGLMMPALQAIIPEIVSREQLMNAVALNMMGLNVLNLVAPGVAGYMIDTFDFKSVYYAMAGLYVFSALFMLFIPRTNQITVHAGGILADIQNGLQYIRRDSTILLILAFTLVVVVLAMPYQQLLPIFADDILKVGATGLGMLMSASGAGALVGSIILASLHNKKRGILLLASGLVSGMALLIFSFSSTWSLSLTLVAFLGLGHAFRGTISGALLQACTEAEYMGRVMAILNMQWGTMSMFTFIAGILAEVVAVQWVVGGLATALVILSILSIGFLRGIRKLD
jgi:MFS transporter, DHA1 family, staphyloferrin A biosynthesis exporter